MENKEIENLLAELEIAKEELHGICTACIHYNPDKSEYNISTEDIPCMYCKHDIWTQELETKDYWEWKGLQSNE